LDSQDGSAGREAFRQTWLTINGILPVTELTPSWQIEFYERAEGGCPVQDFLNALDKPPRAKVLALVRLLAEQGPRVCALARLQEANDEDIRDIKIAEARMREYLNRQKRIGP